MEQQKPKTGKIALNFGIILGAIGIVFALMLHFMDLQYQQSMMTTIVGITVLLGVIVAAIYQYKKANGSYLTLSEALKVGIGTALVGGIISVLFNAVYINLIEPDFIQKSGEFMAENLRTSNPNLTEEQIENAVSNQAKFFWISYPIIIIFNLFVGFIISLIAGLAMKKEENDF
ncbi:DUF4199 domain-containing protein [Robertkochia marina]|uniref:DUF4199 domain-containing protein n=1 Tax=Robertkochia marina TaxID=1227945 RepID=A0A4S3LZE0_9FLAO|nr:DUF4199 domain-containing protein [Robertkochia marina]THD67451.1 DUF4199 domain-containing protein [Robertkochia marina]TRZ44679.1 DUF4199 domain-containing protein [Robertkochia marina]